MASISLKYPIYIVSKGRWENPLTAKIFLKHNIDFKIVVEPQEFEKYKINVPEANIVCTDFSNLGLGSYPARNFAWEHSIKSGHKKHLIFDDNIRCFTKLNSGKRISNQSPVDSINCLIDFTDKFKNVAVSGFNYRYFAPKNLSKPFFINTHVYSGMLINNAIPFRWRLKYNEDVDLCLQALHSKKWCTILLNAYLIDKISTSAKMKGGNQDELYKNNDPAKKTLKSKSLEMLWPQYVKTTVRFNRPHHYVNWQKYFNHSLIKDEG